MEAREIIEGIVGAIVLGVGFYVMTVLAFCM